MKVLVTGAAGFVGSHVVRRLLDSGIEVYGVDSMNDYYDISLKEARLRLLVHPNFTFHKANIEDRYVVNEIFEAFRPQIVINLAAQAGVRYSLQNPNAYIESNVVGFLNILESCRKYDIKHLIFASSSSVYGLNKKMPFSVQDNVDHPISLYAATKKSNELMAHSYSHLFGLPVTGLRFFTVYGPWGRPDMAYFSFTKRIVEGTPIQIFNEGDMKRDFTYIDDIVESIFRLIDLSPKPNYDWDPLNPEPSSSSAPYKVYNIGNHQPVDLMLFVNLLEKYIGKKAVIEFLPMQAGDVKETYADISELYQVTGFKPEVTIESGLQSFVSWYKEYYN
ncbi:NAD-dependent epimerase [Paenibacillus koleovorans]|uniref:NAD-dependent epimerase n=1 Tax=Paenibacillus koleovorans TaxID=121608 RepID=UPI000FD70FA5|nr:NAD-dependent epimerase [Paenibacillus koleovorans]